MQNKKETLLDKFVKKDYNNDLEMIVENKEFNESAKNLLLEILYKIEASYKDYKMVKGDVETKEEYIENILKIVKNKCKIIKVVKANTEEAEILKDRTFIVDKKIGEIICYPIERKLLYAISKINNQDSLIKDNYFIINTSLTQALNVGNNINMVEPLRDFNGWSWSVLNKEIDNIEYNIIYQNLRILIGTKFLNEWINNNEYIIDYLELFESKLEKKYGRDDAKKFLKDLKIFSILILLVIDKEKKEEIKLLNKQVEKELETFSDKEKYIVDIAKSKNEIKSQIKDVDTIINDKKLLQEEYDRRNENLPIEKKIFSRRMLAEIMFDEREELLSKYEEINDLLNPMKYLAKRSELEQKQEYLKLAEIEDAKKVLDENMIDVQKDFMNCFIQNVKNATTKIEILRVITDFRYYCMLPYDLDKNVFEIQELQPSIEQIERKIIEKAIELKVISPLSNVVNMNFLAIRYLFNTKVIKLEETNIKIIKEKDAYYIQFFDENVLEEKFEICKKEEFNKKEFNVKVNKVTKLFT